MPPESTTGGHHVSPLALTINAAEFQRGKPGERSPKSIFTPRHEAVNKPLCLQARHHDNLVSPLAPFPPPASPPSQFNLTSSPPLPSPPVPIQHPCLTHVPVFVQVGDDDNENNKLTSFSPPIPQSSQCTSSTTRSTLPRFTIHPLAQHARPSFYPACHCPQSPHSRAQFP